MVDVNKICERLINTYPDSIVYDEDNGLDFEETVTNFASHIVNDFDFKRQKYYFGYTFENEDQCYKWIMNYLLPLYEMCYEFASL